MSVIASFEITYTQYLDSNGEIRQDLPEFAKDNNTLISLYKMMVQIRAYDVKAVALQRTGNMSTYAQIFGQEAISTGIGHAMQPDDILIPYYRDYAAQLQRGVKMSEIYGYWGGNENASNFAHSHDFPLSVPIGSQCLHAAGIATAFKYKKQPRVAVGTLGEGGTSEGEFYEAINVAGVWNLPLVLVVNNNQWAISVPIKKQTACQTIAQKGIAAGIKCYQVDGNDVIAVRDVVGRAIEAARQGEGPSLIEAVTYRLCDHTTADDASRYRSKQEFDIAMQEEPIRRLKLYLINQGVWNEDRETEFQQECKENVQKAVDEYLEIPVQPIESIFDYHFASLPDYLVEQRAEAMEEASHA